MKSLSTKSFCISLVLALLLTGLGSFSAKADSSVTALPFSQDWSNPALISVSNNWSGVYAITGYRGDNLTTIIDKDPQTILAGDDAAPVVHVSANASNPNTNTTGGLVEFDGIPDQVVALQGSATADAPYLKIAINTAGVNNVRVAYDVRDIDGSTDNSVQQVALHYRIGSTGSFTNLPDGYIADATTGPSLAEKVTHVNVLLPAAADNQPVVELRIMTVNATGNDEWVGIDNISITANYAPSGYSLSADTVLENKPAGTMVGALTASDPNGTDTHTFALVNSAACSGDGADNVYFSIMGSSLFTAASLDYESNTAYSICIQVTDNNGLSKTGPAQLINVLDVTDETPPTVTIERSLTQLDPVNISPINFTVVFSEPIDVSTFSSEDVSLSGTADATTASITEISPNDGTTFNVAVSGMSISGTVTASINAGVVRDPSDNGNIPSTSADNTVTYDVASPIINSFTVSSLSSSLNIPITAFTASDNVNVFGYLITESSTLPTEGWSVTTPATYGVPADGTYTLYPWVKDEVGNVSSVFDSPVSVTVDTAPTVISFTRHTPANGSTNTDTLVFRVSFNEAVINVDEADFAINGISTANVTNIDQVNSSVYDATISGGDLAGFNGSVGLDFAASSDIQDLTGNAFVNAEPSIDETYTLDNVAPDVNIDSKPADPTNSASAEFAFSSADASVLFTCDLDGNGFAACSSPSDYTELSDGSHTFSVKATDTAGNQTTSTFTWMVDATAPDVFINSNPDNPTGETNSEFTFSSADDTAVFTCDLDDGGFAACASPMSYTGLSENMHTFSVKATDSLGNTSTANIYTWTIDITPPDISVGTHPGLLTNNTHASFGFSSTDDSAVFTCDLDAGGYAACSSPKTYAGLSEGPHTFSVKAVDMVGNSSAANIFTWTIDTTAPDVTINSNPATPTNSTNAAFTFSSTGDADSFSCDLDNSGFTACSSPANYTELGEGAHTFSVKATDAAGNSSADIYAWTIDITAPDVSIDAHPAALANSANASFEFSSADHAVAFTCDVDHGGFAPCASPANYIGLGAGAHTFSVKAADLANNSSSTNTYTWTIDLSAPSITSFTRQTPLSIVTNADALVFRATFGEAVANVSTADFAANGTTASVTDVRAVNAGVYDITVSGGNLANFNGTVGLDFNAPTIQDLAGNVFVSTEPVADETYTLDNSAPFVSSIARTNPDLTSALSAGFTVTFSEEVFNVDASDFMLTKTGTLAGESVTGVTGSGSTYTVMVNTGSGNGTLRLDVPAPAAITDSMGNVFSAAYTSGETYTVQKSLAFTSQGASDGSILESSEASNKGGSMQSTAMTFNLGDDASDRQYRAMLSFDTSSIPDNAIVTKVTLKIKLQGTSGTSPFKTHGNLIVDVRKGFFGSSASLQSSDFQFAPSGNNIGFIPKTPVSGWNSKTWTNAILSYINPMEVTQFRLRFTKDDNDDLGADYLKFYSGNASAVNQPQLIVEYYVP